tara:strand:- start:293 stop:1669 length:1377 start_codon:yes stop_codon:yes gene_type:complete
MAIKRNNVGEMEFRLSLFRDGKRLSNKEGAFNLYNFCRGWEIRERLDSSTVEASFVFEDSAGIVNMMTGHEELKLQVITSIVDRTYNFRIYCVHSRSRTNPSNDVFMVEAVSTEFITNESVNVFGQSEVIFKGDIEASSIVQNLLTNSRYLNSKKKIFVEETINNQKFTAPNWRPLDTIYWLAQRSVRKSRKGGILQNGFVFYENGLGYHFRSIDGLIDDINDQTFDKKTNKLTGKPRCYKYHYSPKKVDNTGADAFAISGVTFPREKHLLELMRDGSYSGYSVGFDPVTLGSSKMGMSTELTTDDPTYQLDSIWDKMSHLDGKKTVNPLTQLDPMVHKMIGKPRRIRYSFLPNQTFDPKFINNPQANYQELIDLQAYQFMRLESLKNIQLKITIPGNLDLYVGGGIDVIIPANFKSGRQTPLDRKYSGRYLISSVKHNTTGTILYTELDLLKDSVLR